MSHSLMCDACTAPAVFACGRCKRVRYCGRVCQQLAWPSHMLACEDDSGAVAVPLDVQTALERDLAPFLSHGIRYRTALRQRTGPQLAWDWVPAGLVGVFYKDQPAVLKLAPTSREIEYHQRLARELPESVAALYMVLHESALLMERLTCTLHNDLDALRSDEELQSVLLQCVGFIRALAQRGLRHGALVLHNIVFNRDAGGVQVKFLNFAKTGPLTPVPLSRPSRWTLRTEKHEIAAFLAHVSAELAAWARAGLPLHVRATTPRALAMLVGLDPRELFPREETKRRPDDDEQETSRAAKRQRYSAWLATLRSAATTKS